MTLPTAKHHWNFDKSSGLRPKDAIGGARMRIDRADFRPGKDGQADTCLRFNPGPNVGARLVTTGLTELSSPTWTASMWIKREEDTAGATLLSSLKAGLKLEQFGSDHKLGVTIFGQEDWASEDEIPIGVWAHLVFVGTPSETRIYIDGQARSVLGCSIQLPLKWVGSTHGSAELGAFWLDELQIFDEALTPEQVKELYDEPSKPGLWSWGHNGAGQLGNGSSINGLTPQPVPGFSSAEIKAISAGNGHSLALLEDGTVWAWGNNNYSQLGNGDPAKLACAAPVEVSLLAGLGVKALSAGGGHNLALLEDGTVWVWGRNTHGQHGTGQATTFEAPEKVSRFDKAKAIAVAAGSEHSLALLENGTVLAWGNNGRGQLGDDTTVSSGTPVSVLIPSSCGRVKAIAAGGHSLALLEDGTVWAWGSNSFGQLGNASYGGRGPVKVRGINKPVIAIATGNAWESSLALLEDGTVWAWGSNSFGQLGNGTTTVQPTPTPTQVSGLASVKAIAAGAVHGMALKGDGTLWAWGSNGFGQLGNRSTVDSTTPVPVGLRGIKVIVGGWHHSLAVI